MYELYYTILCLLALVTVAMLLTTIWEVRELLLTLVVWPWTLFVRLLVILKRALDLRSRVHHERAVLRDGLTDGLALQDEQ